MINAIVPYCRKHNVSKFCCNFPCFTWNSYCNYQYFTFGLHFLLSHSTKMIHVWNFCSVWKCISSNQFYKPHQFLTLQQFWYLNKFFFQVINFIFMLSWYSLCQEYKSMLKSTVCLTIWRWEARTSLHSLTLKERRKLLLTCVGIHAKLKQKKRMKHSSIEWRSNSPMSHDIFCMILDLWRRTAGELISWHSSSGEWGCSPYFSVTAHEIFL